MIDGREYEKKRGRAGRGIAIISMINSSHLKMICQCRVREEGEIKSSCINKLHTALLVSRKAGIEEVKSQMAKN